MSHETIRSIFDTVVYEWATRNKIGAAFQNVKFDPSKYDFYVKLYTLPASTDSKDFEGKLRTYLGVYQISVVGRAGAGVGNIAEIAEQIPSLFPLYSTFSRDNFAVQVVTPVAEAKPIQTDTTCTIPISFQYRADIFL